MNLLGASAHAVQLAELLEGVLKLGEHIATSPKDLNELIALAHGVVASGPKAAILPVIVVSLDGGTIVETYGTHPARVIFLDNDTEGGDRDQVTDVLGEAQYVTDSAVDVKPDRVESVLDDLAAHVPADREDEGEREGAHP